MRRSQVDAYSQPARNLFTNPGCETAGPTPINVRFNLAQNPNCEIATGTIFFRTNLCTNPRGINALAAYSSAGNQTITPNVAIADHPEGITTANRVAYTNAANPGVALINPVTSGTTYTVSAWVYHESVEPTTGTANFAQAGIVASPNFSMETGVWTRHSWTHTASGTSTIGFRVSGQAGGSGSFLITGLLVEATVTLGTFFDGATAASGDYTHAWAGTANASTSNMLAGALAGWNTNNAYYPLHRSTATTPISGSASAMSYRKGDTLNSFAASIWVNGQTPTNLTSLKFVANDGIALSLDVKVEQSNRRVQTYVAFRDASSAVLSNSSVITTNLTAGQTTRVSQLVTAPANTDSIIWVIQVSSQDGTNVTVGERCWFDNLLIEKGRAIHPYFDGSTPASGDYTYSWSGTANASTSYMQAPPVSGIAGGNAATHQSTDWSASGTKSVRLVPYEVAGGSASTSAMLTANLIPGRTYTAIATRRLTAPLTGTLNSAYGGRLALIQPGLSTLTSSQLPNTAGVGTIRWTFTVDPAASGHSLRIGHGGIHGSGDVWWDNIMILEGTYEGDYIDGTKPFSKWDGTAHASSSVGYPPQLFDIAGKPEADIVGVGTIASYPVSALGPRTFYFVYEVVNTDGAFVPPYQYGGADDRFVFQSNATGNTSMAPRADFPGGDINSTQLINSARSAARVHVHAISFNQGLTQGEFHYNGTLINTKTYNPGTGWDDGRLIAQNVTGINPRRGMVFHAQHDAATKIAISRYLGNKYGAVVA